jgi:hypothetical protein
MPVYEPQTLSGRAALVDFLNGRLVAQGSPQRMGGTGCTTALADETVTGPVGCFRDVEQGDRFHISGIDTVFTVATKTNDQSLELSAVAGADIVANAGVWRAHRGAAVDPADILLFDADSSGAPTYHIVHKIVTFG